MNGWSPKQASNLRDFRPRLLRPVRLPIPPSGGHIHFGCVFTRFERLRTHVGIAARWLGPDHAHLPRPPTRLASGGAAKAHPKWSSTEGFDPSASTLATLRSS